MNKVAVNRKASLTKKRNKRTQRLCAYIAVLLVLANATL